MAVKYECMKCNKRFVEWGAEKMGFKCPDCPDEELVRVGSSDDTSPKRPSLKRAAKKRRAAEPAVSRPIGVPESDTDGEFDREALDLGTDTDTPITDFDGDDDVSGDDDSSGSDLEDMVLPDDEKPAADDVI